MDTKQYSPEMVSEEEASWIAMESETLGGPHVVSGDKLYDIRKYSGVMAFTGDQREGFLIYEIANGTLKILFIKTLRKQTGIGSALLKKTEDIALENSCSVISAFTTNDDLDALRFYQKRGFVVCSYGINAFRDALDLKGMDHDARVIGNYDIVIRDVIGLCKSPGRTFME